MVFVATKKEDDSIATTIPEQIHHVFGGLCVCVCVPLCTSDAQVTETRQKFSS